MTSVSTSQTHRALGMVLLMVLTPLALAFPAVTVSAHVNEIADWDWSGSNDTGWIRMDATGANPDVGQMALADHYLDFAPGAEIDNLSFEVRVDGANGLWAEQPQLFLADTPSVVFDWRGFGGFGQQNDFVGADPLSSRLAPNSNSQAGWALPGNATVNDLIIEAIRPIDPIVSLANVDLDVRDCVTHPVDGRLICAIGDGLVMLDANNDPSMIELIDEVDLTDLAIDAGGNRLIGLIENSPDAVFAMDLATGERLPDLAGPGAGDSPRVLTPIGASPGQSEFWASDGSTLWRATLTGSTLNWQTATTLETGVPSPPTDIELVSSKVYIATFDKGVYVWDPSTNTLDHWDTSNHLPSDTVTDIEVGGTTLYLATWGGGIVRYNLGFNQWQATWNSGNWLASDDIIDLEISDGYLHILGGSFHQTYDLGTLSFVSSDPMSSLGLNRDLGRDLIHWPAGGARAPANDTVLVGDLSGLFAVLDTTATPMHVDELLLLSGPSDDVMLDTLELGGVVYALTASTVERFDISNSRWLAPLSLTTGTTPTRMVTDGVDLYVGSLDTGVTRLSTAGVVLDTWAESDGLNDVDATLLAHDAGTDSLVVGHTNSGISIIDLATAAVTQTWDDSQNGGDLGSRWTQALTTRGGIAYVGLWNAGVERIDIANQTRLAPWQSTGVDDLDNVPMALDGDLLHVGLYGFGVLVINTTTGEHVDRWEASWNGPGGGNGGLRSNNVLSLAVQAPGIILIGTENGASRHTSSGFQNFGGGNGAPQVFQDFAVAGSYIFSATEDGACYHTMSNLQFGDCWDAGDGLPGDYSLSIEFIQGNRLYVGQYQGAGVIDVNNNTVTHSWEAGEATENAIPIVIGDVAYLGYDGLGILRYDLLTDEWLSPWDATTNLLESDGVTAMIQDIDPNRIWVGGDMGLNLIDVPNATLDVDWDDGNNGGGISLPTSSPEDLAIIGDTLYYSLKRTGSWQTNDNIYRYDIVNLSQKSTLDAGASEGYSAFVHGMSAVDGILHVGISPTNWWTGDGAMLRYDHAADQWMNAIGSDGQVNRVNAKFGGDCDPSPTDCHLFAAYGDQPLRMIDMNGSLERSWDATDISGPIRGIVTWDGAVLFGTESGIMRYDWRNDTWLTTWDETSGLPNNVEEGIYAMETIDGDLWVSSMANSGWNRNAKISVLDGSSGNWVVHDVGSGQVPEGYGADFGICDGIVHVAIGRWSTWGNQGGIARWDPNFLNTDGSTGAWLSDWNQGQGGLPHDFATAIACDEAYDIVYIGFQEDDGSIARYDYVNSQFLAVMDENDGVTSEYVFPGAMEHRGNQLMVGHSEGGGTTWIATTGPVVSSITSTDAGVETTSFDRVPGSTTDWAVGRAGGSSGYNRVDGLNSNGLSPGAWDVLAHLSTGRIADFVGNGTHIWVAPIDDSWSNRGSAILEGIQLPNGSISWQRAWNLNSPLITDMMLDGQTLWVTAAGWGLIEIDLSTGAFTGTGQPLHRQAGGIATYGNEFVVGLMGTGATSAGVQRYDPATGWGAGRLVAGLPSNIVTDFEHLGDQVFISTLGGLGVWNLTLDDWNDPVTTIDGLPTPALNRLDADLDRLMITTDSGLFTYNPADGTVTPLVTRADGLVGTSVDGAIWVPAQTSVMNARGTLWLSHGGVGSTRPGYSVVDVTGTAATGHSFTVRDTELFDTLPSNQISALAADWWGVHIATDEEPLMHWNAASGEMELGVGEARIADWPVLSMESDGNHVLVISGTGIDLVDAQTTGHAARALARMPGFELGHISSNGIWMASNDGLYGWGGAPAFQPLDRFILRRADPLMANFAGDSTNITADARPGNPITLVDAQSAVTLPDFGNPGPGGIPMTQSQLTLTSPVDGAPIWLASRNLNYSGSWDLAALNGNLAGQMQTAINYAQVTENGRSVHLQLQSPLNGSIEVRITYDWIRNEIPSELNEFYNRPDDGGGVIVANWSVTQDHNFAAYRIYLNEGSNWSSPPSAADLVNAPYAARIVDWTTTTIAVNTHGGAPLNHNLPYWGLIVIEYPDGSLGTPSAIIGPATPLDEVPTPPIWADAGPANDGEDGDLFVEWTPCTALDIASTRIWTSDVPIQDAVGLAGALDLAAEAGNNTTLSLEEGRPYWVALTCVDEGGRHDPANATIIGPVVPTGGIDDGIPPAPLEDIAAWDTPDDEGGRLNVSWTPSDADDCAYVTIYIAEANGDTPPLDASMAGVATVLADCLNGTTVISEIDGANLVDLQPYWVTVVAFDKWGNGDLVNVTWAQAAPVQDGSGGQQPPDRAEDLAAWDTPDDDGTSIDVTWRASDADDFDFYVVWASEHSMDNLALKWLDCQDDPAACGLLVVQQQRQGMEEMVSISMQSALYGQSFASSNGATIIPDQPLWVAVTVHDVKGNAFLTQMADHMVSVTPIDNRGDITPPDRLDAPSVTDRADDSGDGLVIEWTASTASDISHYEIYADAIPFTDVDGREPVAIVDRSEATSQEIESLSGGQPLSDGLPTFVTVVAVDSAGNAWTTDLAYTEAFPVDDLAGDPGLHLPEITGVEVKWNAQGTAIVVTWDAVSDPQVRSFSVFISDGIYADNRDADLAMEGIQGTRVALGLETEGQWDANRSWYISVVAHDGDVHRYGVDPVHLAPWVPGEDGGGDGTGDEETSGGLLDLFGDIEMVIIALLGMLIGVLLLVLIARLRRPRYNPLDHASPNWGLPVENWDDDPFALPPSAAPEVDYAATLMPAASNLAQNTVAPPPGYDTAPVDPNAGFARPASPAPAQPAQPAQPSQSGLDTSFLDDLL